MTLIHSFALVSILLSNLTCSAAGLSQSIAFPLTEKYSQANNRALSDAFGKMVDSTDFFVQCTKNPDECLVPLFGNDVRIKFRANENRVVKHEDPAEFLLTVEGVSGSDFGWICTKFYEFKKSFPGLDMAKLTTIMEGHHFDSNVQDTDPSAGHKAMENMFQDKSILQELEHGGYVVVDTAPKSTNAATLKLSQLLVEKTKQHKSLRRDSVRFIEKEEAYDCDLGKQYDFLMSIAGHMNDNMNMKESPLAPLYPATKSKPLTNPQGLQAAEFGKGEFYLAHSDNSETSPNVRRSFRHYTCIMYLNDDWNEEDGGALRLYPLNAEMPENCTPETCEYVDILPHNGRLVIFDSTLIHSVEPVTHNEKLRRALTLWINRPEDIGDFQ